jgi:hypothetical protein
MSEDSDSKILQKTSFDYINTNTNKRLYLTNYYISFIRIFDITDSTNVEEVTTLYESKIKNAKVLNIFINFFFSFLVT